MFKRQLLSDGRLRLGVGVGWNHVEYEALDCEWKTRRIKQAEQIEVLRKLWTEELVTFEGRFHKYNEVTIVPSPKQRPIPIWIGGSADSVIKRAAKLGDGWMPILSPDKEGKTALEKLYTYLEEFGRKREGFGIETWMRFSEDNPEVWGATADEWRSMGVDMAMLYPMWEIKGVDGQIEILRKFKEVAHS